VTPTRIFAPRPEEDAGVRARHRKLGLLNGVLISAAVAAGAWAPEIVALATIPLRSGQKHLLLGLALLLLLGGLAGWLSAYAEGVLPAVLVWAVAAIAIVWVIGHAPAEGRSFVAWLSDRRFWGVPAYPFFDELQTRLAVAAFFIILVLLLLAAFQGYRLEGVRLHLNRDGGLNSAAWLRLLLPLPLVVLFALVADSTLYAPYRTAILLVDDAIRTGQSHEGDLDALSRLHGVNYSAIKGVRTQMQGSYRLAIGEIQVDNAMVFIVANFSNGAWIYCRVMANFLSYCYDASPPYIVGLTSLITETPLPEDCLGCGFAADDAWREWLSQRGQKFAGAPQVSRSGQQGSYVLVRALSPAGDYAVDCLFYGISRIRLDGCTEVATK
jgi:hypothetical protein